jgi:hypothetical protein
MVSSNRPRTPSGGAPAPQQENIPPLPKGNKDESQPPRRSSLGLLLRRSKSGDFGKQGSKKQQAHARELELQRQQREAASRSPPSLPVLYDGAAPPQLQSFGGEDITTPPRQQNGRGSMDPRGGPPVPPMPTNGTRKTDWVDPYARTESMTHRGRYSYASSAVSTINSPRRVRRRKDPTPFKYVYYNLALDLADPF